VPKFAVTEKGHYIFIVLMINCLIETRESYFGYLVQDHNNNNNNNNNGDDDDDVALGNQIINCCTKWQYCEYFTFTKASYLFLLLCTGHIMHCFVLV